MKQLLPFVLFFLSSAAFGQDSAGDQATAPIPVVFSTNIVAYVNGIRLDSIDAVYATFNFTKRSFAYGQISERRKDFQLTNEHGVPLLFETGSEAFYLNFLYENGWELLYPVVNAVDNYVILRKRNDMKE